MIDATNSYDGKHRFNIKNGLPVTSKDKAGVHGIGLENVRDVAHKSMGDIDIKNSDNVFEVSVLLQEPR